jgi:hypothetical protein
MACLNENALKIESFRKVHTPVICLGLDDGIRNRAPRYGADSSVAAVRLPELEVGRTREDTMFISFKIYIMHNIQLAYE